MLYIVKQKFDRFNNGFYWIEMSFADICKFFAGEEDEEIDYVIQKVALLNINECFEVTFFGGNFYAFKRTI